MVQTARLGQTETKEKKQKEDIDYKNDKASQTKKESLNIKKEYGKITEMKFKTEKKEEKQDLMNIPFYERQKYLKEKAEQNKRKIEEEMYGKGRKGKSINENDERLKEKERLYNQYRKLTNKEREQLDEEERKVIQSEIFRQQRNKLTDKFKRKRNKLTKKFNHLVKKQVQREEEKQEPKKFNKLKHKESCNRLFVQSRKPQNNDRSEMNYPFKPQNFNTGKNKKTKSRYILPTIQGKQKLSKIVECKIQEIDERIKQMESYIPKSNKGSYPFLYQHGGYWEDRSYALQQEKEQLQVKQKEQLQSELGQKDLKSKKMILPYINCNKRNLHNSNSNSIENAKKKERKNLK